jgi:osmotically-inducible protein OsmY
MANQGAPHGRNGNHNRDYDRDRDFISRQGRDDDRGERTDERRDGERYAMARNVRDRRDPERDAYDRNNFGPTYPRSDERDERYAQRTSRGAGDWGQYDDGRVTYGRRGEGQGFRESTGYDAGREREPFGAQGGWNTEDRFGRRDEYHSNQDYGMRGDEYGRGQSGVGAGYQPREPQRDRPGNYGVGARDSERADRMQRSFRGVGPQGYTRSDQRIQEDVSDTFTDDHHLDAANITVKVASGEVTLTGTVADRHMKYRAEELAERITGVKEIDNQLRVHKRDQPRAASRDEEPGAPMDDKARKSRPS